TIVAVTNGGSIDDFTGTGGTSVAAAIEYSRDSSPRPEAGFRVQLDLAAGPVTIIYTATSNNIPPEHIATTPVAVWFELQDCDGNLLERYDDPGELLEGEISGTATLTAPATGEYRLVMMVRGFSTTGTPPFIVTLDVSVSNSGLQTLGICYDIEP
ncbi:MAG TPA: hypothetical protein VEC14_06340, partial [Reyranellaceae bacterium]|nr:hypothetical protein [Reyranellaceae bacterium]